ncbi:MAG: surfeit locus 1 family protein [Hyphomicrobiaceae bacterium]|jgi:surfeit locus 1 family protein
MIARLRGSGLLWPAVATALTFCVLIALGNWQWQRMHWKQDMIVSLKQAAIAKPIRMRRVPSAVMLTSAADFEALQFRRATVTGTFLHDLQMHVWAPGPSGPAWSVITPLRLRPTAPTEATHLFVIRGTVLAAQKAPVKRKAGEVRGEKTLTGRVRLDQPNTWANEANIKKNEWFTRDLAVMTAHLQASTKDTVRIAPFFLEAERPSHATAPEPDLKALNLSNRHLEYALTWWGLAATLLGVFAAFAIGRLKTAGA